MSEFSSTKQWRIDGQSVDVWRVLLDIGPPSVAACRAGLSAEEQERADRFKFEEGRRRFTVARAALRRVLSRYGAKPPAAWQFSYGAHGKPSLASGPGGPDLRFNVSHANELAVIAVTLGREVGVDVEWLPRRVEFELLARRFFSARESAAVQAADAAGRRRSFFQIWTRKEAWLKARGVGIGVPLDQFDVLEHRANALPTATERGILGDGTWQFADFQCAGDYLGAVVVAGDLTTIRLQDGVAE